MVSVPLLDADFLAISEALRVAARNVNARAHGQCVPSERAEYVALCSRLERLQGIFERARSCAVLVDQPAPAPEAGPEER